MKKYIESEKLELKEKYTDIICKEIVSFLNGNGGTILIGVRDDGTVVGVDKIDETLRKISDIITTQIFFHTLFLFVLLSFLYRSFLSLLYNHVMKNHISFDNIYVFYLYLY